MANHLRLYRAIAPTLFGADTILLCVGARDKHVERAGSSFLPLFKGKIGKSVRYTDDEIVPFEGPVPAKIAKCHAALLEAARLYRDAHPAEETVSKVKAKIKGAGAYTLAIGGLTSTITLAVFDQAKGIYVGQDVSGAYIFVDNHGKAVSPTGEPNAAAKYSVS